jgi:hypothetical protein
MTTGIAMEHADIRDKNVNSNNNYNIIRNINKNMN